MCAALFVSAAPVRVGCLLSSPAALGLVRVLPFLCCWSALVGRLSVLERAFWGFLLLFALLHLFPLLRLFVTCTEPKKSFLWHRNLRLGVCLLVVFCSSSCLLMHSYQLRGGCRAGLRLLPWWQAVWFDVCVVSSLAACIAPRLGGCFLAPRAVWLACVGRLTFLVRVCL